MNSEMFLDILNDMPDEDILITAERLKIGTEPDDNKGTKCVENQSDTE